MTFRLRLQCVAIFLLSLFGAYVALPIPRPWGFPFRLHPGSDLAGGAELRYKVLFDPQFKGDRRKATREATDVLRRRTQSTLLQEPRISSYGDDEIVIQLPGIDADGLREMKRRISTTGKLEFFAAASPDLQERFRRDQVVPPGTRTVGKAPQGPVLVEERPVLEGRHLTAAEARPDVERDGAPWVTVFDLDAEGARRFDEAAERLYRQDPRGRMVIVLDGELRSAPVVNSPAFHGRGQITSGAAERK